MEFPEMALCLGLESIFRGPESTMTLYWSEGGGRSPFPERHRFFLCARGRGAWARRGPPACARSPFFFLHSTRNFIVSIGSIMIHHRHGNTYD